MFWNSKKAANTLMSPVELEAQKLCPLQKLRHRRNPFKKLQLYPASGSVALFNKITKLSPNVSYKKRLQNESTLWKTCVLNFNEGLLCSIGITDLKSLENPFQSKKTTSSTSAKLKNSVMKTTKLFCVESKQCRGRNPIIWSKSTNWLKTWGSARRRWMLI